MQSLANFTSMPSRPDSALATGARLMSGTRLPSGRPRWDIRMTLAPLSRRYLMVGSDSRRRLSLSTTPSFSGTLKSTRTITRLPRGSRSSTNSFLPVLMGPVSSRDPPPAGSAVSGPKREGQPFAAGSGRGQALIVDAVHAVAAARDADKHTCEVRQHRVHAFDPTLQHRRQSQLARLYRGVTQGHRAAVAVVRIQQRPGPRPRTSSRCWWLNLRLAVQPSGLATQPSPASVAASNLSIQNTRAPNRVKGKPNMDADRVLVSAQVELPSDFTTQASVVPTSGSACRP